MKQHELKEQTKNLVDITIQKHKDKLLGKEKMSKFIKNNLPKEVNVYYYNNILHLYCKYLAQEGYEIRKDINKFDIIDYNSEEYETYYSSLKE